MVIAYRDKKVVGVFIFVRRFMGHAIYIQNLLLM
jgi:hypothetical protein